MDNELEIKISVDNKVENLDKIGSQLDGFSKKITENNTKVSKEVQRLAKEQAEATLKSAQDQVKSYQEQYKKILENESRTQKQILKDRLNTAKQSQAEAEKNVRLALKASQEILRQEEATQKAIVKAKATATKETQNYMKQIVREQNKYNKEVEAEEKRLVKLAEKNSKDRINYERKVQAEKLNSAKASQKLADSDKNSERAFSSLVGEIGAGMIIFEAYARVAQAISDAFRMGAEEAVKFEKSMSLVNTIVQAPRAELEKMTNKVGDLGSALGKMPDEMAQGMYQIASSTNETVDRIKVLELATKASVAGFTDVNTAVDAGTSIMNAYQMSVTDLPKIYDVMFKTVDKGKVTFAELNQGLSSMISSAVNAKVPLDTLMGQFAFLTQRGIKTEQASTALARAYDAIYEKSKDFKKIFNIDVFDNMGKVRDSTEIFKELGTILKDLSNEDRIKAMQKLGLEERAQKSVVLMADNFVNLKDTIDKVTNSNGQMEKAFTMATDNIYTEWQKVKAKFTKEFYDFMMVNKDTILDMINTVGLLGEALLKLAKPVIITFKFANNIGESIGTASNAQPIINPNNDRYDEYEEYRKADSEYLKFKADTLRKQLVNAGWNVAERVRLENKYYKEIANSANVWYENRKKDNEVQVKLAKESNDKSTVLIKKNYIELGKFIENNSPKISIGEDIQEELNKSLMSFSDWSNGLKGVFANVMKNSGVMSKAVAQDMYNMYSFFADYMKKLPMEEIENVAQLAGRGSAKTVKSKGGTDAEANAEYDRTYKTILNMAKLNAGEVKGLLNSIKNQYGLEDLVTSTYKEPEVPKGTVNLEDEKKKKDKKDYDFWNELDQFYEKMDLSKVKKDSEEWLKEYKNFLDGAISSVQDSTKAGKQSTLAFISAKIDITKTKIAHNDLVKKNDDEFKDILKFSESMNDSSLEAYNQLSEQTREATNKFNDTLDTIYGAEAELLQEAKDNGTDTNSKEFRESYNKMIENQIKDLRALATDKDKLKELIPEDFALFENLIPAMIENLNKKKFGVEGVDKYKPKEMTSAQKHYNDVMSESINLVNQLSTALGSDLLGAISSVMSGIQSIQQGQIQGGVLGALGQAGGYLAIATAVIGAIKGYVGKDNSNAQAETEKAEKAYQDQLDKLSEISENTKEQLTSFEDLRSTLVGFVMKLPTASNIAIGANASKMAYNALNSQRNFGGITQNWREDQWYRDWGDWGKNKHRQRDQSTSFTEEQIGTMLGVNFDTANVDDLRKAYNNLSKGTIQNATTNSGVIGEDDNRIDAGDWNGIGFSSDTTAEFKANLLKYIEALEQAKAQSEAFTRTVKLSTMTGIQVLDAEAEKQKITEQYVKAGITITEDVKNQINGLVSNMGDFNVTIMQDVRKAIIDNGGDVASAMKGYVDSMVNNAFTQVVDSLMEQDFDKLSKQFGDLVNKQVAGGDVTTERAEIAKSMMEAIRKSDTLIGAKAKETTALIEALKKEGAKTEDLIKLGLVDEAGNQLTELLKKATDIVKEALKAGFEADGSIDVFTSALGEGVYNSVKDALMSAMQSAMYAKMAEKIMGAYNFDEMFKGMSVAEMYAKGQEVMREVMGKLESSGLDFGNTSANSNAGTISNAVGVQVEKETNGGSVTYHNYNYQPYYNNSTLLYGNDASEKALFEKFETYMASKKRDY